MSGRRMIHGDVCEDRKINSITEGAEVMFYRLLSKTDDYGVYFADPGLLKGKIFPRRDELTVQEIRRRLVELVKAGFLLHYQEGDELYVQFKNFEKRQNFRKDIKRKSRFPKPAKSVGVKSSINHVTDLYGDVTDADESEREGNEPPPSRNRTEPLPEDKKRQEKTRKGGGGSIGNQEPPPPPKDTDHPSPSPIPEKFLPESGVGETAFLVDIYLKRFPNAQVPERTARTQIERALSSNVTAQEIYESIEETAAKSSSHAEKIWTLLDPLIQSKSVSPPSVHVQKERSHHGGLSMDEMKEISVAAKAYGSGVKAEEILDILVLFRGLWPNRPLTKEIAERLASHISKMNHGEVRASVLKLSDEMKFPPSYKEIRQRIKDLKGVGYFQTKGKETEASSKEREAREEKVNELKYLMDIKKISKDEFEAEMKKLEAGEAPTDSFGGKFKEYAALSRRLINGEITQEDYEEKRNKLDEGK